MMNNAMLNCPHSHLCSGCACMQEGATSCDLEEIRHFFSDHGIPDVKLHEGPAYGWRCRAKLAVRGSAAKPLIGLYKKGSHDVLDIPNCPIHHPAINQAAAFVRKWIIEHNIAPYDETSGNGLLRYLQITVDIKTSKTQLVLVLNCSSQAIDQLTLKQLWDSAPDLWHSLFVNINCRKDNVIFGSEWIFLFGSPWLWETINGKKICFHPASFIQANLKLFEQLVQRIEQALPEQADLLEFYAGVGSIGIGALDACKSVCCIEINPTAKQCFEETKRHLGLDEQKRLEFIESDAPKYSHLLQSLSQATGAVIVDPPRKGLDAHLLNTFCRHKHFKLIYVSCGWPSFKRDCKQLLEAGWQLEAAEAFLFFPGSEHVEILAIFK